jgi:hypothetical protein
MNHERRNLQDAILHLLGTAWEKEIAVTLDHASDGDLLHVLGRIDAQLRELRESTVAESEAALADLFDALDDVPDWDDKTPEELAALAEELETPAAYREELSFQANRHEAPKLRRDLSGGARKRTKVSLPVHLNCEELEPRLPPSAVAASLVAAVGAAASLVLIDRTIFTSSVCSTWSVQADYATVAPMQSYSAFRHDGETDGEGSESGTDIIVVDRLALALVA